MTTAPNFGDDLFFSEEHIAYRDQIRRFVATEISPNIQAWDDAGTFPRELYRKASEVGILPARFPETYGGIEIDRFFTMIHHEEIAFAAPAVGANLTTHTLALPPILSHGSEELRARIVPPVLSGDWLAALAITEPGGGSDVASIATTARRDGDHYIVNGEKTFITGGMRADVLTVAVRTGDRGRGGISVLVVEGDTPGLTRMRLRKMGWHCSDTATLHFQDCRVPAANLVGEENRGFAILMNNFNDERLYIAASAYGTARAAFEEALDYARIRKTFGKPILEHQVIRHKLVDMAQKLAATRAMLLSVTLRVDAGRAPVGELSLLKNQATQTLAFCANEAVQIFGGAGFMNGSKVERIYREVKVMAIGGGTEEIMKELAAKQLGF
ncbi:acyl-CoA dehydrogenase family protein [Salipiger sp. P9]|uniref:acyl-CoA dehydrogenase family protein n=1 Tax=Salipiger pentaromativorans TaxID=2943193 RepID=UPI0021570A27|nr:acyl-CoA dehydrogenase family protein [Salipiger pentaromativorans]